MEKPRLKAEHTSTMTIKLLKTVSFVMIIASFHGSDGIKRSLQIPDITKLHISSSVQFRYAGNVYLDPNNER